MYLMDQVRGQWDFPDLLKNAGDFWKKHSQRQFGIAPASEFWIENKASGISLVQTLRKHPWLVPARAWEPKDKTPRDKVGRANHSSAPIYAGRVFLPDWKILGQEFKWVEKWVNEHTAFTKDDSHLNDDQVDAHTEASAIWQERGGGVGPLPNM
jgi:predicted phage terminase large subunit-like protein